MTGPTVGQRVVLATLTRKGHFPGEVIDISPPCPATCIVKLDCQDKPVDAVKYYDERPVECPAAYWQVCWPEEDER